MICIFTYGRLCNKTAVLPPAALPLPGALRWYSLLQQALRRLQSSGLRLLQQRPARGQGSVVPLPLKHLRHLSRRHVPLQVRRYRAAARHAAASVPRRRRCLLLFILFHCRHLLKVGDHHQTGVVGHKCMPEREHVVPENMRRLLFPA